MTDQRLYPLGFEPIFQYRLWGGRALGDLLGTPLPDGPIGEAWILSDREDHASKVRQGPLAGQTLTDLMARDEGAIMGRLAGRFDRFPLLLKFLDVDQMLSVQVHPRDDQAELIPAGETGKTEAWIVLAADPKSRIYAGLKPGTSVDDLRALSTDTADDHLASFKPEVGQGVLIEAGSVHSLGDGVMVFEVQENSDVTFRLYDWDHVDAQTGKPRDLQVDQALACIDVDQGPIRPVEPRPAATGSEREAMLRNEHFNVDRVASTAAFDVGAADEPRILVCIEGSGAVAYGGAAFAIRRGGVMLLPAAIGVCRFSPDASATILEIAVPDREQRPA